MHWIATTARSSPPHFCSSVCLSRQQLLLDVTNKRVWISPWIEYTYTLLLFSWLYPIISKTLSLASNHTWKKKKKHEHDMRVYVFHLVGRLWSYSSVLAPQKFAYIHFKAAFLLWTLKDLHTPWSPIVWAEWTCAFSCWVPIICCMKGARWGCWCLSP